MIVCKGICELEPGCFKHAYVPSTMRYELYDKCSNCNMWLAKDRFKLCPCCHGKIKSHPTNKHKQALLAARN